MFVRFQSLILVLLLVINVSCRSENNFDEPFLEVSEMDRNISFLAEPSFRSVNIETNNENFSAVSNVPWCHIAVENTPSKKIKINVDENEGLTSRSTAIEITAGFLKKTINVTQLGLNPEIIIKQKSASIDFRAQTLTVNVTTNIPLEITSKSSWLKLQPFTKSARVDLVYKFDVDQLQDINSGRIGVIYFKHKEGKLVDSVTVRQAITTADIYNPALTNSFEKDKKIKLLNATLIPSNMYQNGEGIEKSIDGVVSTIYHSPWQGIQANSPLTLEYTLDPADATIVNYVVLHPRTNGINGIIREATIWVSTAENPGYIQVGNITAANSNNPVAVYFSTPVVNPRKIKIVVTDSYSQDSKYYVSLAEFECYESKTLNSVGEDMLWFTDMTFSELKAGVSLNDVAKIKNPFIQNIATYLIAKKYPLEYRVQNYEPYREVADLAKELKMSSYSQFENITGIHFSKDEEVVVFVGKTSGEKISLRVRDFGSTGDDNSYPLHEGINLLSMKGKGNGYISYYTPNYQSAGNIKVHIASGKVNGYFDLNRHNNSDGSKILDNAVSEILDIRGNRTQLAFTVKALRSYSYSRVKDLIEMYDSIISMEQTILGLKKFGRLPKNRMFGRVVWDGYMFADGLGAGFNENTMSSVANPEKIPQNNWGIAHEFGHVNQVRPGMKWVGTTECTNNIYSAWVQYVFSPDNLRLEHENVGGSIGGRYNSYFNSAFIEKQEWGIQAGPDKAYGADASGVWGGDHFVKLVPLWQLQLYFHVAGENNNWHRPYFWADIFEKVRLTDEKNMSDGLLQINFIKNACDALRYDLSDFFIQIGMLKAVDKVFDDYTKARKTITQSMVDEAISYAGKYPKPESPCIHYICGNNLNAYKYKRKVTGVFNSGVTGEFTKQVDHGVWKDVVAFETYSGNTLIKVTMTGSGSATNSFTNVPYPSNSTRIEAVSWDGTRVLVFGTR